MLKHVLGLVFSVTVPLSLGCSGGVIDGGGVGDGGTGTGDGGLFGCVGRGCNVNTNCPSNLGPTTLTGTVRIPAGTLPLYNAKVYIPSGAPPSAPTSGASCLLCDQVVPGDAVTSAVTDINGNFTLTNVPHGTDIPLVIRVGKWQRVVTIPNVQECTTTPLDATMTRLPRNKGEGNIPQIALSTGGADALECLLRSKKLGLDDTEFTNDKGDGRVHLFAGGSSSVNNSQGTNKFAANLNGGASFTASNPWWDQAANLSKYDIVVLSCEGDQIAASKSTNARAALQTYINSGGRVFASHWHNIWIAGGPAPLNTVATFVGNGGGVNFNTPITADINITPAFTKGVALADWLQLPTVGGTTTRGKLVINNARITTNTLNQSLTQTWVTYNNSGTVTPQYFSFNAPVGASASAQCGQMVFTDMHVSGSATGDTSSPATAFPGGCITNSLSAQEKALIFMLFDLTNCLQPQVG
jgi:hypothetical protein